MCERETHSGETRKTTRFEEKSCKEKKKKKKQSQMNLKSEKDDREAEAFRFTERPQSRQ